MTMIPGAYEPRHRVGGAVEHPAAAPMPPGGSRDHTASAVVVRERELPAWLRLSLAAFALLAATWLAMFVKSAGH